MIDFSRLIDPNFVDYTIKITVAAFAGGLVGIEREIRGRSAGIRTHILVSVGSALFMIISYSLGHWLSEYGYSNFPGDPGRIAAQLVSGIGFIGGGAILKEGTSIRGLTTAACLWMTAAIGMAAGCGQYLLAIYSSVAAVGTLLLLNRLDIFYTTEAYRVLQIVGSLDLSYEDVKKIVNRKNVTVIGCDIEKLYREGHVRMRLPLKVSSRGRRDHLSSDIFKDLESAGIGIVSAKWSKM